MTRRKCPWRDENAPGLSTHESQASCPCVYLCSTAEPSPPNSSHRRRSVVAAALCSSPPSTSREQPQVPRQGWAHGHPRHPHRQRSPPPRLASPGTPSALLLQGRGQSLRSTCTETLSCAMVNSNSFYHQNATDLTTHHHESIKRRAKSRQHQPSSRHARPRPWGTHTWWLGEQCRPVSSSAGRGAS